MRIFEIYYRVQSREMGGLLYFYVMVLSEVLLAVSRGSSGWCICIATGEGKEQFLKAQENAGKSCYGLGIAGNESESFYRASLIALIAKL